MTDVLLAILIAGPAALTAILKSNGALGFLAICTGFVLSTSVIGDLKYLLSQADLSVTDSTLAIALLITPLIISLVLVRGIKKKSTKYWFHIAAALCAGGLLALSIGPIISSATENNLAQSVLWNNLVKMQSVIIGLGAVLSFCLIWLQALKRSPKKKH